MGCVYPARYMAPEQANGRIDLVGPASDMFSLGAMLYEIITGTPPYASTKLTEVLAEAQRGLVEPARKRNLRAPAALEAVCARAMATLPADRYARAEDMASEVERFLADEPVAAYRDPPAVRLRRWVNRRQTLASALAVLVLVGTFGLLAGLLAVNRERGRTAAAEAQARGRAVEAEANLDRALAAENQSQQHLARAEDNLKLARKAIDEVFGVATKHPVFQEPRMKKSKQLLLAKTLPFYKDFRAQRPDDPELQHLEAIGWNRVAMIHQEFGNLDEAKNAYGRARELQEAVIKAQPNNPDHRYGLSTMFANLALLLGDQGKHDEAIVSYRASCELLAQVIKDEPGKDTYRLALAGVHDNLGILLAHRDKNEEALTEYLAARALLEALVKANPTSVDSQAALGLNQTNLGALYCATNEHAKGLEELLKSRDTLEKVVKERPENLERRSQFARACNNAGRGLTNAGKHQDALNELTTARTLGVALIKVQPNVPRYRSDLATTYYSLGKLYETMGKREDALEEYHQAREHGLVLAENHLDVIEHADDFVTTLLARGDLLMKLSRSREALADFDEVIRRAEQLRGRDPKHRLISTWARAVLPRRAFALEQVGRTDEADELWNTIFKSAPERDRFQVRLERAFNRARAGNHAGAAADVEEMASDRRLTASSFLTLAAVQAINAGRVAKDDRLNAADREKLGEKYARAAVALLRRAASEGLFGDAKNIKKLDAEQDFAAIRDREDYREFRKGLKTE